MNTRGTKNAHANANVNAIATTSVSDIKYATASELLEKAKSNIGHQSPVLKELCKLPSKRRPRYLPSTEPQGLSDRYASRAEAVVAQSVGTPAREACGRCEDAKKVCFTQCIVVTGYFSGACANCHFSFRDYGCSLSGGYGRRKKNPERLRSEDDPESEDDTGGNNVDNTGLPTQAKRRRLNVQEGSLDAPASVKDEDRPSTEPAPSHVDETSDDDDDRYNRPLGLLQWEQVHLRWKKEHRPAYDGWMRRDPFRIVKWPKKDQDEPDNAQ